MTGNAALIARRLRICGKVQGVGYRAWAVRTARGLQVDGWVRNLSDGNVELFAIGPDHIVTQMISECRNGPPGAVVRDISIFDEPVLPLRGFAQKPTL